jgi:integrase
MLQAARQFCRWAIRYGIADRDPLGVLRPLNTYTDRRYERRALTDDELRALLSKTETQPKRYKLSGPDRVLLYRLAVETGLRANELRSLMPASFENLEGEKPRVRLKAAHSKRRRVDVLPLRPDTARALLTLVQSRQPTRPVFHVPHRSATMLRTDLAAAGIKLEEGADRSVDFHSLRVTFISNLALAGVPMKLAQTLARHSTPVLTFNVYAQLGADEERKALERLPNLGAASNDEALCGVGGNPVPQPDEGLQALVEQWPNLSGDTRAAMLRVAGIHG